MKHSSRILAASVVAVTMLSTAGMVFAQSSPSASSVPSQACVQAMADAESKMLSLRQSHLAALKAAALITNDADRAAALKKAREDMHLGMQQQMEEPHTLRAACGDMKFAMRGTGGMGMKMKMKGMHKKRMPFSIDANLQ